jgi:hypothetical protein
MDEQLEEEMLLYVAADIDPLTAFAALPREAEPSAPGKDHAISPIAWIVIVSFFIGTAVSILL